MARQAVRRLEARGFLRRAGDGRVRVTGLGVAVALFHQRVPKHDIGQHYWSKPGDLRWA